MKTLLGLLLMALTTYAAPNAVPDTHDCDPRALDMNKKNEHENFLPFNKFVEDQVSDYEVIFSTNFDIYELCVFIDRNFRVKMVTTFLGQL